MALLLYCISFASIQGSLEIWTEHYLDPISFYKFSKLPKLHATHARGGFLGPWPFIILKSLDQDLSNKGSTFILGLLEVGD